MNWLWDSAESPSLHPAARRYAVCLTLVLLWAMAAACATAPAPLAARPETPAVRSPPGARPIALTFERLTLADGLSQSGIYSIVQDPQGFLWLATEDGLNRYDGYEFAVFRPNPADPASLSDGFVQTLLVDRDGRLWVGTNSGLDRFDPLTGTFSHVSRELGVGPIDVLSLHQDAGGSVWIGTHGDGLLRLDAVASGITKVADTGRVAGNVHALAQDHRGTLWIGAAQGLFRLDAGAHQTQPALAGAVFALLVDDAGLLWVGTTEGVTVLDPVDASPQRTLQYDPADPTTLGDGEVRALYRDRAGTIWIGTTGGLNRIEPGADNVRRYSHDPADDNTLAVPYVRALFEDREGTLWVGTYGGGVAKAAPFARPFRVLLDGVGVTGMVEQPPGTLWAGTLYDGLFRIDLSSGHTRRYAHDPADPTSLVDDNVWAVCADRDGAIWVGTVGGLSRLDPAGGTFTNFTHTPANPNSPAHSHVWAIEEDHNGWIWIGTEAGLDYYDRATGVFTHVALAVGSDSTVTELYEDSAENLWIGSFNNGLIRRDGVTGQLTHYPADAANPAALSHQAVVYISEDPPGTLWVGTYGGGLNRFDAGTQTFTRLTTADGLPNDAVYAILPGGDGTYWLSTNHGLARFHPTVDRFDNYDVSDGLQSNEFNLHAALRADSGELLFGGIGGVTAFDPQQIRGNPVAPPVVLTSVTQGGVAIDLGAPVPAATALTLTWPRNFFEFEFAALSFVSPEDNRYAYRLDGFDTEWIENGTRRFGRYTNLPGGTYTLQVKGSNGDGTWNEQGVALTVVVVPPLWERPWAQALFVLTIVATVVTAYGLRMRAVEMRSRELETEVAARTADLVGLNALADAVSQSLDWQATLDAAVGHSAELLACEAGGIYLLNDEPRNGAVARLELIARYGLDAELAARINPLLVVEGFCGRALETGAVLLINDLAPDQRLTHRHVVDAGFQALAVTPLMVHTRSIGTLFVMTRHPRTFGDRERILLAAIGAHVGVAVENARLYERAQEGAILAERQRIARDLHDSVTQALYGVALYSEAASGQLAQGQVERANDHLTQLRRTAQEALAEMRLLIHELRPPLLAQEGLAAALQARLQAVEGRAGLHATFWHGGDSAETNPNRRLPVAVEQGLYRIGQEALNNALKHARATRITVHLRHDLQCVALTIRDNGSGFLLEQARSGGGSGLANMAQRAAEIGGTLAIDTRPGAGTTISVEVPL